MLISYAESFSSNGLTVQKFKHWKNKAEKVLTFPPTQEEEGVSLCVYVLPIFNELSLLLVCFQLNSWYYF